MSLKQRRFTIFEIVMIIFGAALFLSAAYMSISPFISNIMKNRDNTRCQLVARNKAIPDSRQSHSEEKNSLSQKSKTDSSAIGCIHFNVIKEVFEVQKKQFLSENSMLHNYKIQSVNGFYYDDRLAVVQIISYPQDAHKKSYDQGFYTSPNDGWERLYSLKYTNNNQSYPLKSVKEIEAEERAKRPFDYKTQHKGIKVTDFAISGRPQKSIEEVMEKNIEKTYRKTELFPNVKITSWIEGVIMVNNAISYLPGKRQRKISERFENALTHASSGSNPLFNPKTDVCDRIYHEILREANAMIQQDNDRQILKHKNDPSYSIITIYYLPAYDKYMQDKSDKQNQEEMRKNLEKKKAMNLI